MVLAEFTLDIKPLSKERPRSGASGHFYTPKRTKDYEAAITAAAYAQLPEGFAIATGPVAMLIRTVNAVPKSWSKAMRREALAGIHYPKRGDLDNRVKAITDALNGIYYLDDEQIVVIGARKMYGTRDYIKVTMQNVGSNNEGTN